MKQIKITKGTYGFRPSPGIVEPKTSRDPAFSVDDAEAARLVAMGVASVAGSDEDPDAVAAFVEPDDQDGQHDEDNDDHDDSYEDDDAEDAEPLVYNEDMKLDELKDVARSVGASEEELTPMRYKKDVIALIDQILEEASTGSEGDDDGPDLGAADPV